MKWLIIIICALLGLKSFSQVKPTITIGTGVVIINGIYGLGGSCEITLPFNKNLSYGLNSGYSMASDKKLNTTQIGSYNQSSTFYGNFNVYFNPKFFDRVKLLLYGGGGVRHINSTQILVNSNFDLFPSNDYSTGFGLNAGLGIDYYFAQNYILGVQYLHDFYKDGFDYIGIKFGLTLNSN